MAQSVEKDDIDLFDVILKAARELPRESRENLIRKWVEKMNECDREARKYAEEGDHPNTVRAMELSDLYQVLVGVTQDTL